MSPVVRARACTTAKKTSAAQRNCVWTICRRDAAAPSAPAGYVYSPATTDDQSALEERERGKAKSQPATKQEEVKRLRVMASATAVGGWQRSAAHADCIATMATTRQASFAATAKQTKRIDGEKAAVTRDSDNDNGKYVLITTVQPATIL